MNLFSEIKNRIDFQTGLKRLYPDLAVKWQGSRGVTNCVFHAEKDPSLVLYKDGFYCFGCGAKGDLIDFVAAMENCSLLDAARRIAAEFGLPIDRPPSPADRARQRELNKERRLRRAFKIWERQIFIELCEWRDRVQAIFDEKKLGVDMDEAELIHQLPEVEYMIEILATGREAEKLTLFKRYLASKGERENEPA